MSSFPINIRQFFSPIATFFSRCNARVLLLVNHKGTCHRYFGPVWVSFGRLRLLFSPNEGVSHNWAPAGLQRALVHSIGYMFKIGIKGIFLIPSPLSKLRYYKFMYTKTKSHIVKSPTLELEMMLYLTYICCFYKPNISSL